MEPTSAATIFPPTKADAPTDVATSAGTLLPPTTLAADPVLAASGATPYVAADALLLVLADALDDLERVRIASSNRLRALRDAKGLAGSKAEQRMAVMVEDLERLEHDAILDLQRAMRSHPLGPWVKRTTGVGEKQAARLIAAIGWPADRANPAKLWQFAGHGDPARSRRVRGERMTFSPGAKMRTHLVAVSCIKHASSPYRPVYEREREKWSSRDVTDGHRHNHALRVVGKRILLDLWREARLIEATPRAP
jgi:hypothetical protein